MGDGRLNYLSHRHSHGRSGLDSWRLSLGLAHRIAVVGISKNEHIGVGVGVRSFSVFVSLPLK